MSSLRQMTHDKCQTTNLRFDGSGRAKRWCRRRDGPGYASRATTSRPTARDGQSAPPLGASGSDGLSGAKLRGLRSQRQYTKFAMSYLCRTDPARPLLRFSQQYPASQPTQALTVEAVSGTNRTWQIGHGRKCIMLTKLD